MSRSTRWLILGVVLLAAAIFRLWQIGAIPPGFHFDESFEGLEAWRILTDPTYRPIFLTGNFGVPPLNAYANALTFGVFRLLGGEAGPTAMRTTSALFGVLGVGAVYLLGMELRLLDRDRLTTALPLFAAAILATLRWHVHFSRIGIEPVMVPLLWAASTWLLLRGWRTRGWLNFVGCGVLLAACMYAYQGAWIIPLLMIPVTLHLWLHTRWQTQGVPETRNRPSGSNVVPRPRNRPFTIHNSQFTIHNSPLTASLLAALIAILLVLPLLWFFLQNPDLLLLRPTQIAVTGAASSIAPASAWDNVRASVLMFVPIGQTGDLDPRRNLPGAAALNGWQAIPFWLGVGIAIWRVRNPAYSIVLIGLVGLLLPGVFSEYAPHFHRVLGAAAPAALLCGLGLDSIWRLWVERGRKDAGEGRGWSGGLGWLGQYFPGCLWGYCGRPRLLCALGCPA